MLTLFMVVMSGRADRVLVMYAARQVESAETSELFHNLRHPYTEALLASIPQLDQDKSQRLYSIPGLPPDLTNPPQACRFAPRCAFATDICRTDDPPLGGPSPQHPFACFHPRQSSADEISEVGASLIEQAERNRALTASFGKELELLEVAEDIVSSASVTDGANGSTSILEFRDVSKEFPITAGIILQRKVGSVKAVTGVNLAVRRGETFGLVGESGCGKTTLGRMGVVLENPTSGQVLFDGCDLATLSGSRLRQLRRDLQMMFQDPYSSLDPRMRVNDIIREPLDVAKRGSRAERERVVGRLLDEVGLPQSAKQRYPHEFSGGQRQRLGLARALALNPKLIVADEPVSALDVSIRSQILNLMKRLQASHGLTYIVISHDLSVVRYLADRIGVMYLGRLVEIGTGEDIYNRAAHPYTAGLLDSIPVPNPEEARAKLGLVGVKGELPSSVYPPSGCRFRTRCPRAQDRCAEEVPDYTPFGGEHLAACHFPLKQPVVFTKAGAQRVP
jgi:oligopeptide/dipeptide ABC transporter ATP-binding protein